ncbi:hypothetical protein HKX48_004385 [Thoreauomyces humboldtii]|nr:hypothetical protein HKX48_004385 [Thoreauomyces humboldtii]
MPLLNKSRDPRRDDAVQIFKYQPIPEDELDNSDILSMAAIGLGLAGLLLKNQWMSWGAFAICVAALCNYSVSSAANGPPTSMISFAVMGLVGTYQGKLARGEIGVPTAMHSVDL